jgi:RNA polymerase sigma factor (sigma-70 family)
MKRKHPGWGDVVMGNTFVEPRDIQAIFAKPGREWTKPEEVRIKSEKVQVLEWLNEPVRLRYFLVIGLRVLGEGATRQDAEDTWQEFFKPRSEDRGSRFDPVVETYDGKGGFLSYFTVCWTRFCLEKRRPLRNRLKHELTMESKGRGDDADGGIELEVVDQHPDSDPALAAERKEQAAALAERKDQAAAKRKDQERDLAACLSELNEKLRAVLVMHYLESKSFERIGQELEIAKGTARVRACRARQRLAECLEAKIQETNP